MVPESLQKPMLLLERWQWIGLFMLILLAMISGRIVNFVLDGLLKKWRKRLERGDRSSVPEDVWTNVERPAGLLVMGLVFRLLMPFLLLPAGVITVLKVAVTIFMTCAGVWLTCRIIDIVGAYVGRMASKTESKLDDLLVPMVRRSLKVFVVAFGLIFIAQNLNIEVSSLLAGLGIGGLAFALAAKDLLANIFGSVMILVDQPFRIGDWVVIGDAEGTVEDVGFRYTRIRTFYNSLISLPNSVIVNTKVDNLGMRTYRRCSCMISVTYDTPPDRIEAFCEGIRELVRIHPYTRKDYFNVYFNKFAASSLDILLYVFWQTPDWPTELQEKHRLFVDIVRLANHLGVEFAFPTQTLHLVSTPGSVAQSDSVGALSDTVGALSDTVGTPSAFAEAVEAVAQKAAAVMTGGKQTAETTAEETAPLLTGTDMEQALELGRATSRELVKSTLGEPAEKPPQVTFN